MHLEGLRGISGILPVFLELNTRGARHATDPSHAPVHSEALVILDPHPHAARMRVYFLLFPPKFPIMTSSKLKPKKK